MKKVASTHIARAAAVMVVLVTSGTALAQQGSIVNTKHNLSASGPGQVRATGESQVCIFCHTPHNAAPIQPLWNRHEPANAYKVYSSNSLQARPGQPTGSSKLCLSCHDGTIALGSVLSRDEPIAMANGVTTLPPGASNLGTDLSDDHPISFRYDAALVTLSPKLKGPTLLPPAVHLDDNQELQCTSCHDPHNDANGNFLVMDNSSSQLCEACHQTGLTEVPNHQLCASCHQSHTAPSGPYLLTRVNVTDTCISCHNGQPGPTQGPNLQQDLAKIDPHDTHSAVNLPNHVPDNVNCRDCHDPHTMRAVGAAVPLASGRLGQVSGVGADGTAVAAAQFEYEVCFKCHGPQAASQPQVVSRQILQTNKALQFAPTAISFHPVEAAGRNLNVPSLLPPLTTASLIYCTDCHASETSVKAGGTGPNGPHGSIYRPLLIARYDMLDNAPETAQTYALCYRCHDRNSILADQSFPTHALHVAGDLSSPTPAPTPCSTCHDAHGIASVQGTVTKNAHLINFNTSIVQPDMISGQLQYDSTAGVCFLNCHNANHSGAAITVAAGAAKAAAPRVQSPVRTLSPLRTSPPLRRR